MKKKILAMMSALILTITCIAPLNVKANFDSASKVVVYFINTDDEIKQTCIFNNGYNGHGCGYTWSSNDTFKKYNVATYYKLQPNQTIEITYSFKFGKLNNNDTAGVLNWTVHNGGTSTPLHNDFVHHEYFTNHESNIYAQLKYTNNTGEPTTLFQMEYTNLWGNYTDYTLLSINAITINVYDEQGRLIEKIENGVNLLHQDLVNINEHIYQQFDKLNQWISNQTTTLTKNLGDTIAELRRNLRDYIEAQTVSINQKLDDVIAAIRGDDKEVGSKDDVDNTTNDLDNTINEYEDIENSVVDDFNNNFGSIKPNNDLITNNDFINTSTFVAAQMTKIYESNSIIKMTITFGLIIGLAFTVIGISVRR